MASQVKVKAPRLSICVLSWNTQSLLQSCLDSIYADPRAGEWEVVVVDNASTDGSAEMVRARFPQVELVASSENLGFSRGNNLAMEKARGPYLLLLNSDTRVESGALGALVDFMERERRAGAAGPKLLNADGSLQLSCGIEPSLASEFTHKLLLHKLFPFFKLGRWDHGEIRSVGWVAGSCLLVRRRAAEEAGFLDPSIFMFHEDVEWCMRIRKAGWKVFYYPFSRVVHLGGQSTRQARAQMLVVSQRSLFYLFQKHFGRTRLAVLRALTLVEMGLRSLLWCGVFLVFPSRRREGRQRLKAYREILARSLMERSYWAPFGRL